MIAYLQQRGLSHPARIKRIIEEGIGRLQLDLSGMVVLTEAASRNYVVTPIIAAMARALKVYAITADSRYGSAQEIADFTYGFSDFCGVRDRIEVIFEKKQEFLARADIITNLGFVRPIDEKFVGMLEDGAVVAYMYEAWELREGDVDLHACQQRAIPVMATDEGHPDVDVFRFSGPLCVKMLHALEIEVYRSKIAIVSRDPFGDTLARYLRDSGAEVGHFSQIGERACQGFLPGADALIVADYQADRTLLGKGGELEADELARISPSIAVVQFSGGVEIAGLDRVAIPYFPKHPVPPHHMGLTLAELGPKPVISLHAAGLKVGEAMRRARVLGLEGDELTQYVLAHAPAQSLARSRNK